MDRKSDEKISIFVRDQETGRLVFNACALQSWDSIRRMSSSAGIR